MKAQFGNKVMSSFLLHLDNAMLKKGEAYTNHSSLFYPDATNKYYGYYGYSAPYKQLVSDHSITGANVMSGVYVNSSFTQSNIHINHYNGQVFFNSDQGSAKVSGNYAVKDFNVSMTNKAEQELLFETKFQLRPKTNQTITGLEPNQSTYPAIFVKNMGGENKPWAFGGMDNTVINTRCVVLSDSSYKLDAACSIMKDMGRGSVFLVEPSDLPFNALGLSATGTFNSSGLLAAHQYDNAYVKSVTITNHIPNLSNNSINTEIHAAFVDFRLETPRMPGN
jgi:hypothetical protein